MTDPMLASNILLVDDNPRNLEALEAILADLDIGVFTALDADQALNLLTEQEFFLTIIDVQMAPVSGFELASLIRGVKKYRHLPIIFLTAHAPSESFTLDGYDAGAMDVLYKPINPQFIRAKVDIFLELDKQRKALQLQYQREERLRLAAESSNEARALFLANISHEMRSPLGAIIGYAELMRLSDQQSSREKEFSQAIVRRANDLTRIIDGVLDLTTIESSQFHLQIAPFHLPELLDDVHAQMEADAKRKGLSLNIDIAPLPATDFVSDETRIRQVIVNILGNAIKFTEQGAISVAISMQHNRLVYQVKDSGIGISEEHQNRLFQPFSQADISISRRFGGTGLGLALSRELCQMMGGDLVLVSSVPKIGSVFQASFRFGSLLTEEHNLADDSADAQRSSQARLKRVESAALKGLYIDDLQDNRIVTQTLLSHLNIHLDLAESGVKGIEMVANNRYDFILLDIQMPDMDGYEVFTEVRAKAETLPIIALSASAMDYHVQSCLDHGFDAFIAKPLVLDKLIDGLTSTIPSLQP